jgi:hypothetical protein
VTGLVGLTLAFLLAGCAEMSVGSRGAVPAPAANPTAAPVAPTLYQPDDLITVNRDGIPWAEISVTQVNEQPTYRGSSGYVDSADSGTYIAMFVTYKALAQNVMYNLFDWQLYVDDVAVDTYAAVLNGPKPMLSGGTLPTGRRAEGWLVYDIPKTGRVLLSYGSNPFSNQPPIFEVVLREE